VVEYKILFENPLVYEGREENQNKNMKK